MMCIPCVFVCCNALTAAARCLFAPDAPDAVSGPSPVFRWMTALVAMPKVY